MSASPPVLPPALRVLRLWTSPAHNFYGHHGRPPGEAPTVEVAEVELVAGQGIAGDRFFGHKAGYKGQITFFDAAVFERLCAEFGVWDKDPGVLRRNALTTGVDLNGLIGKQFELQGVSFRGREECRPCYWMDTAFAPGTEAAMRGFGGLRAEILTDGVLRAETAVLAGAGR